MSFSRSEKDVGISMKEMPESSIFLKISAPGVPLEDRSDTNSSGCYRSSYESRGPGGIENRAYSGSTISTSSLSSPLNMSIVNCIPAKPLPQIGPFESLGDPYVAVNHHKKFFGHSEKLYVTKDGRGRLKWKRFFCGTVSFCFVLLLVVGGLTFYEKSKQSRGKAELMATDRPLSLTDLPSSSPSSLSSSSEPMSSGAVSTTLPPIIMSPTSSSLLETYLPTAADVECFIDEEFDRMLYDKTSSSFLNLSHSLETIVANLLQNSFPSMTPLVKVREFAQGSIIAKLRIFWMESSIEFSTVQFVLGNVSRLGNYSIKSVRSYAVFNMCNYKNNGCSNTCSYDPSLLNFVCSCPETMLLSENQKNCFTVENVTDSEPLHTTSLPPLHAASTTTTSRALETTVMVTQHPNPLPHSPTTSATIEEHTEHRNETTTSTHKATATTDNNLGMHVTTEGPHPPISHSTTTTTTPKQPSEDEQHVTEAPSPTMIESDTTDPSPIVEGDDSTIVDQVTEVSSGESVDCDGSSGSENCTNANPTEEVVFTTLVPIRMADDVETDISTQ